MKDLAVKQGVLKEIMDLMDKNEGDNLKKHPKLIAAKVEVEKPEVGIDPIDGGMTEGSPEEEKGESPEMESKEDAISPELLQKLIAHFQSQK